MFNVKPNREDSALQIEIDALLNDMAAINRSSEEYAAMVDLLTKLYALKEDKSKRRPSPDTLAVVAGNLAGILMIVGHEKAHVVTSKALNFVMKAR
jgi:hypothetical protein